MPIDCFVNYKKLIILITIALAYSVSLKFLFNLPQP